jgi:hypothetical protein
MDLRIGGAVARDTLLSFDLSSRAMADPTLQVDGTTTAYGHDACAGDAILGLGLTRSFMPANAFVAATLGTGGGSILFENSIFVSGVGPLLWTCPLPRGSGFLEGN